MKNGAVRVLVVDDSALMRKLIPQMLTGDDSIEVVGTAMDGSFCLKKIEELKPNVVTLDLEMPGMNGIDTLKEIMRRQPVPVIVFSSHSTEGASVTMKALGLGAFDFVTKPKDAAAHMAETARELHKRIARFVEPLARVGRQLGSAVSAYNEAVGSFESRVIPQLRRIEDAGASSARAMHL